ncbi:MAG: Oxidoreductase, FAD-binding, partial [uncultured Solirubrobacteraceae bacterium]
VAELERRAGVRPGGDRAATVDGGGGRRGAACGGRRADGPRGRRRTLVHRRRPHRRDAAVARPDEPRHRREPLDRPGAGAGRHPDPRAVRGARPARARAREPRRHQRAVDRRGDRHRDARHRLEAAQSVVADRGRRARDRRRHGSQPRRRRAVARGARVDRRARRHHRDDPARGAALHAARRRRAATALRGDGVARRDRRREPPLRVLRLPALGSRADPDERGRRRGAAPAGLDAPVVRGRPARQPRAARGVRDRQAQPGAGPADQSQGRPVVHQARPRRSQRPDLLEPAARAVHRDGAGVPARGGGRGHPRDPRGARALPGRVPHRGAVRPRRRRAAQPRRRARDGLHRRAQLRRDAVGGAAARGAGDRRPLRRPAALGQAPLPDRRDARAALPGVGDVRAHPRGARPRRPVRERLRAPDDCWRIGTLASL